MKIYKGYVLLSELYTKAKVSNSLFRQLNGVVLEKLGGYEDTKGGILAVKIDSLSEKYEQIALDCIDLEKYYMYSHFSQELGMCKDWLSVVEYYKKEKFNGIQIGKKRFIELPDKFINIAKQGYTPFKITAKSSEYAEYKIIIQGIEIGFY